MDDAEEFRAAVDEELRAVRVTPAARARFVAATARARGTTGARGRRVAPVLAALGVALVVLGGVFAADRLSPPAQQQPAGVPVPVPAAPTTTVAPTPSPSPEVTATPTTSPEITLPEPTSTR